MKVAVFHKSMDDIESEHTPLNATFLSLGLDEWLVQALAAMSIRRPTPIQAACIHPILEGNKILKDFTDIKAEIVWEERRQDQERR